MARRKRFEPVVETVSVTGVDHQGRGIATGDDGKTIFVHGGLPGEKVELLRRRRHRRFDEAQLLQVLSPSSQRVQPKCQAFDKCGGCALQHLSSKTQLEQKQQQLMDGFQRLAQVEPASILPPLLGPAWAYRRRGRLAVRYVDKKERVLVGFRERSNHYVADIERCEILAANVGGLFGPLAKMIAEMSIRRRLPQIEVAVADNGVALVFRVLDPPSQNDLAALREFGKNHDVFVLLQPGGLDSIVPLDEMPTLYYRIPDFDLKFEFGPADFIQINAEINQAMIRQALELVQLQGHERVLDLFCGLGNFSLPFSKHASLVVGIEGSDGLVTQARHNAQINGCKNVDFHTADLFQDVRQLPWAKEAYDVVILDPPRAGAKEVLECISQLSPSQILYVSCHPGTLARDAKELVHVLGFELVTAGVIDMFPHTAHVESMALFRR